MTAFPPREEEEEPGAPRVGTLQILLLSVLGLLGLGVTAYEVLGLGADDFGGSFGLAVGGVVLLAVLGAVLRH